MKIRKKFSMRQVILFCLLYLGCGYVGSSAAAPMAEVVGAFTLACMKNVDQPSAMSGLNKDAAKLRPDHAQQFLKPDIGSAYLHSFDNGGRMIVGLLETGGCKISSQEALRGDVERMVLEVFRRNTVPNRVLANTMNQELIQTTYAVVFQGKRIFLVIFGPRDPAKPGAHVEISPATHPPKHISPQAVVDWPN
jgi:hypothetical protein